MIKHVVMWKFKEGTEAQMNQFLDGLRGLVGQIEVLKSLEVGANINPKEKFSASLICEFDSMEDLNSYATDPRHVAVASICKDITLERVAVDFEE
ncbi:MAG: Dabb family protein [Succinivibrio dextrinosolvens]|uniref:Stress responsive A/B Barrel Domain n=3 Tax=Succinivibrio dextrinosolvens TaxID=83771 RepID=A0A1T4W0T5_9GAMM|nr:MULTISPECIES: Dabb family protein [Succinivibrio]MBQ9220469.1 Dabb family protein [Succinivibrio sp.]MDY6415454.1 Dabb family protein [Succinivibrio dextrinosolvens]MDY6421393.1 Dabb family protein [Succinivibrio dextrinosolvens]MDY6470143.1 Dabb family protein [Succinivibrio dextrinosolvens]SFK49443.1 Stress responsive A/B Barrel Domain [Succinivibrio dextrinosolvens]